MGGPCAKDLEHRYHLFWGGLAAGSSAPACSCSPDGHDWEDIGKRAGAGEEIDWCRRCGALVLRQVRPPYKRRERYPANRPQCVTTHCEQADDV